MNQLLVCVALAGMPLLAAGTPLRSALDSPRTNAVRSAPAAIQASRDEQELTRIEQELTKSSVSGDAIAWERYVADSCRIYNGDGTVTPKAQLIKDLKSGDLDFESSEIDDIQVRVFGDSAVVTFRSTDKGRYKDRDISGVRRWMDVFVRQNGRWQLVTSQGADLPRPAGPDTSAGAQAAEKELLRIEEEIFVAAPKGDTAPLERHLASSYTLIDADGILLDKVGVMTGFSSGDIKYESTRMVDPRVRIFGDTAVVTWRSIDKGAYKGKDFSGVHRGTDTFVRQNGRWQMVSSQYTRIAAEPK